LRQEIDSVMYLKSTGVTASIGLAAYPASGVTAIALVSMADGALYRAKNDGGNCTRLAAEG